MSARETIRALQARTNQSIIGQARVVERLIIALLTDGNVLLEGSLS
jgi:MoxR-like ATPase